MTANVQDDVRVDLVFEGQLLPGFERDPVRRALAERFKLDDARLDRMFAGAPYVLKRDVAREDASRYIALFAKLGARLMAKGGAAPAPAKAPAPVRASAPASAMAAPLALVPVAEPPPSPAATPAPYDARSQREHEESARYEPMVVEEEPPEPAAVFGVGFAGRLARRQYGAGALFGWAAIRWATMGLLMHPRPGMVALIGLGMVVAMLWTFRLTILRLHDLGLSGWWVLLGFVPYVNTVAGLLLSLVPGSTGDNRYGKVPDEGSLALRYVVVIGVLCISAGFRHGLLMSGVHDNGAAGNDVAELHARSSDAPVAPTDDELNAFLKTAGARREFRDGYWPARHHKAFASSESGPSGWVADMGTAESAKAEALARCDKARDAYASECRIVQVDGDWAD